jgi:hypothetical protein
MVMASLENQYIWHGESPSSVEAVEESSSTSQGRLRNPLIQVPQPSCISSTHRGFEDTKETTGFVKTHRQLLPSLAPRVTLLYRPSFGTRPSTSIMSDRHGSASAGRRSEDEGLSDLARDVHSSQSKCMPNYSISHGSPGHILRLPLLSFLFAIHVYSYLLSCFIVRSLSCLRCAYTAITHLVSSFSLSFSCPSLPPKPRERGSLEARILGSEDP